MRIGKVFGRHCMNDFWRWRPATEKNLQKSQNKFGGFNYLLYLCIGNKEVTKTLLIQKENNKLWTQLHAQPTSLASSQNLKSKTTSTEEI